MSIFDREPTSQNTRFTSNEGNDENNILIYGLIALLLCLFVFLSATFLLMSPAYAMSWSVCGTGKRITCVVDGDTFWKDGIKYRLFNVDTPEAGIRATCNRERELANSATLHLQSIFNAGNLNIQEQGHDRYGRVLATVFVNGANVSALLISEGVGKSYPGGKRDPQFWCR